VTIACLDAAYRGERAVGAAVLITDWRAGAPIEIVTAAAEAAPYEPGAFYKRELPVLVAVLGRITVPLSAVVIDGYVWLDRAEEKPGLGAHLWQAIDRACPVMGVAKTAFADDHWSIPVLRGKSGRPLYVTAVGMGLDTAVEAVRSMAGAHRIPEMLKLADRKARAATG
jgi:deoxyribonuclease V